LAPPLTRLVVIGDAFVDHVAASAADERGTAPPDSPAIAFVEPNHLRDALRAAGAVTSFLGGPVFNTVLAIARCQPEIGAEPPAVEIAYAAAFGALRRPDDLFGSGPWDRLRAACIRPVPGAFATRTGETLALVDPDTGRVLRLLIYERREDAVGTVAPDDALAAPNVLAYASDLDVLPPRPRDLPGEQLFVVLGDASPAVAGAALRRSPLLARFRRVTVLGHARRIIQAGLTDAAFASVALRRDGVAFELVGTAGRAPVRIVASDAAGPFDGAVPDASTIASELGAGDAYAGGYVFAKLRGAGVEAAHRLGVARARDVLAVRGPSVPDDPDLNRRFARAIDRSSSSRDEGRLFDRVRLTPGTTVLTGGQTGVETLALAHATALGYPSFAIMPQGRRTERGEHDADPARTGDAVVVELGSPRFRYRTWATAYLADATLLWDYTRSEGSVETVAACAALNRPCLNVAALDPATAVRDATGWIAANGARVLYFAGNRASRMAAGDAARASGQIAVILTALATPELRAFVASSAAGGALEQARSGVGPLRIGLPKAGRQSALLRRFVHDCYGLDVASETPLLAGADDAAFAFFRSRDLVAALDAGSLDGSFVGSDALVEAYPTLVRTGLFAVAVVMTARPGVVPGGARRVCSQYPNFSARFGPLVGDPEVTPIQGSAEAWMALGGFDAALDTWKTGETVLHHGLALVCWLANTSLVFVARRPPDDPAVVRLLTRFAAWLRDAGGALVAT
jgi:putative molybdenum carrier protein/ATP phosphoribosyltransferase